MYARVEVIPQNLYFPVLQQAGIIEKSPLNLRCCIFTRILLPVGSAFNHN